MGGGGNYIGYLQIYQPEVKVIEHMNDITGVVLVLFLEMVQDSDLFLGLAVEPLLISHLNIGLYSILYIRLYSTLYIGLYSTLYIGLYSTLDISLYSTLSIGL